MDANVEMLFEVGKSFSFKVVCLTTFWLQVMVRFLNIRQVAMDKGTVVSKYGDKRKSIQEHACVHDVSDGSPLGKYSFLSLWKPGMRKNMIIG